MMARRGVIGALAGGAALLLGLAGCSGKDRSSYRFRMSVEVDTPDGMQSGSSVYEVSAHNTGTILPDAAARLWNVRGEAVAVDLPNGRTLFALLKTGAIHGDLVGMSMTALDPAFKNDIVESAARIAAGEGVRSSAEVPLKDYPMLVTFDDLDDPTSVKEVDPDDLAASLGEGVSLRRIVVEVTGEPVTSGIDGRLGWLDSQLGSLVKRPHDLPIGQMPRERQLNVTAFRSGVKK